MDQEGEGEEGGGDRVSSTFTCPLGDTHNVTTASTAWEVRGGESSQGTNRATSWRNTSLQKPAGREVVEEVVVEVVSSWEVTKSTTSVSLNTSSLYASPPPPPSPL